MILNMCTNITKCTIAIFTSTPWSVKTMNDNDNDNDNDNEQ